MPSGGSPNPIALKPPCLSSQQRPDACSFALHGIQPVLIGAGCTIFMCHDAAAVGVAAGIPVSRPVWGPVPEARIMNSVQAIKGSVLKRSISSCVGLIRLLLLGVASGVLVGCASTTYPPAPATLPAGQDYTYVIGPGDGLNIIVWRNPELSMNVPVRPDGKVSAPLVEELMAQGKTSVELARDVEKVLGKYVRDPIVTVLVTGFQGPYSEQIRVVGEAARPQFLSYKVKMTLLDVMISVGGLTDFAAGNKATILRTTEGNKQYSVRIQDLLRRGDVSANVEMRPGDILIIPQSLF